MKITLLKFLPDFAARTVHQSCCVCGEQIPLYQLVSGDYYIPANVNYSRIRGDSANGYEYSHHGCLQWEDK